MDSLFLCWPHPRTLYLWLRAWSIARKSPLMSNAFWHVLACAVSESFFWVYILVQLSYSNPMEYRQDLSGMRAWSHIAGVVGTKNWIYTFIHKINGQKKLLDFLGNNWISLQLYIYIYVLYIVIYIIFIFNSSIFLCYNFCWYFQTYI